MTIRSLTLTLALISVATIFAPLSARSSLRGYYSKGYSFARNAWNQNILIVNECVKDNNWSRLYKAQHKYFLQVQKDVAPLKKALIDNSSTTECREALAAFQLYCRGAVDSCETYDLDHYCNSLNITQEHRNFLYSYLRGLMNSLRELSTMNLKTLS